jgi:CubicO group peptidase (beta-lactamase class C family)
LKLDENKIDLLFAKVDQCSLPGAAVGIAVNSRPVYRKGFGLANMELPVILSPTMRMRIGSITKHFTALVYLLLCEEGRAALHDPIGKYLPELHPTARKVTVYQLLGHTSGLRDAMDLAWHFGAAGQALSSGQLLAPYRDISDVSIEPGGAWIYNNGGYLMVSLAIERITGQSLEEVLRERIFAPVGMHDTMLRRVDTDFVPNSATLHTNKPGGGFEKAYLGTALAGEGGVVSTVDDMLRWLAHMDTPVIGSSATWEIVKTPQTLTNGSLTGYGLGLTSGRYRGVETLSHDGGVLGGGAEMIKVPAARLDVVVMVNRQDLSASQLANDILDACLVNLEPVKQAAAGSPLCGVFRSPTSARVLRFLAHDSQPFIAIDGIEMPVDCDDSGLEWYPISWRNGNIAVRLLGDPKNPAAVRLDDFGNIDEMTRASVAKSNGSDEIAGRYRSDAADVEVSIRGTENGVTLTARSRFGSAEYTLEILAADIWQARFIGTGPWGGILSFASGSASFRFFTLRTRALNFRRIG